MNYYYVDVFEGSYSHILEGSHFHVYVQYVLRLRG